METLLRPAAKKTRKGFFLAVVLVSLLLHAVLLWWALSGHLPESGPARAGIEERFRAAVTSVTDLDPADKARLESVLASIRAQEWERDAMAVTLRNMAARVGVRLARCEVVRALDRDRSREGRWDIVMALRWAEGTDAQEILSLVYLVGEATLKSRFGSHRFWLELQGADGTGRVAFETMDCRLYRNGKLSAVDLLYRAAWAGREPVHKGAE